MTTRKIYTKEFKQKTVRLVRESGKSCAQIARDLGLSESVLGQWKKELESRPDMAFPGNGVAHDAELRALRRENEVLRQERGASGTRCVRNEVRQEREVLKKAIAIFSGPEAKSLKP